MDMRVFGLVVSVVAALSLGSELNAQVPQTTLPRWIPIRNRNCSRRPSQRQ